jgi:hypothetical protein
MLIKKIYNLNLDLKIRRVRVESLINARQIAVLGRHRSTTRTTYSIHKNAESQCGCANPISWHNTTDAD